ncbi:MAG TPA: acetyl-CoA C-acyltransferase [Saprospiraceae bacterium]|nr:acetyl-CoA C-acyltransferase [Saprospiraceae bacterium]MCC6689742.1 acetyl-CoA C-acyltransferase [Saprospiraceae bacterium]HMV24360.1 acetyl-CoA C-acyltransferase [Saprospiraceae bacterium]HMX85561.1 acetyl-CoA C-acyltransferase [Saprospiraceae bacterium]HNA93753.1 acetyl-CoA C-acyltransferase [Saprospiraceae bacterium]
MKQAFIIDGVRTAVGSFGGSLAHTRADDMAAHVIRELVKKLPGIDPGEISDVIMGCANQAGEDNRNVARMALLLAGIPYTVPGETVNRLCASGMSAVIHACRAIRSDEGEAFIAGGVENMTRGPWVISKASTPFGRDAEMHDTSFGWRFINKEMQRMYGTDSMGNTAENLAQKFGISRDDQDAFALWSQEKAAAARHSGRLGIEIVPIEVKKAKETILFDADEFIKPSTTAEILSRLNPAFRKAEAGGSVTAGNSSGLNDGAAALLTASEDFIKKNNLKPLSRIVSSGVAGVEPFIMGIGPVEASRLALSRAGLSLAQMDIIEINEAFAAQVLACTRSLGLEDKDERINPNGGAIAIGHPLGMSGTRILHSASIELSRRNARYALVTMCIGVGQGYAVILEKA